MKEFDRNRKTHLVQLPICTIAAEDKTVSTNNCKYLYRFLIILLNASARLEAHAEHELSLRKAALSSECEKMRRLALVLRHSKAVAKADAEVELRRGVSFLCRLQTKNE